MTRRAWMGFVAVRYFRSGRDASPSLGAAVAGIAIGVSALIVVIGVMNGFQAGFMDAVLEMDSFHVRVDADSVPPGVDLSAVPGVSSALEFSDLRTVATNARGRVQPIRIKLVPRDATALDPGLAAALDMRSGQPAGTGGLVVGSELARTLDLLPGGSVSILSVTADEERGIETAMVSLPVSGVFHCGFYDFDAGLAYLPADEAAGLGDGEDRIVGVKLEDRYDDLAAVAAFERLGVPREAMATWRTYNRSFFGALRLEKAVMMALVGLIFLVVGVNIFHAMRKTVIGRMQEIATLKATGATPMELRGVFVLDGLFAGAIGACVGLALGLFAALNINEAFSIVESAISAVAGLFGGTGFAFFSPELFYMGDVPVVMPFPEVLFIAASGAASAIAAAWAASGRVSGCRPAEVLRDE